MVKALIDTPGAAAHSGRAHSGRAPAAHACLVPRRPPHACTVFGLWKARALDGLAYQEALRAEW
ncbi:hypothetical protein DIE21_28915 [Burkholderia sp. Bp9140]|uniref:hypothetical protein n=1 Tax=Burkholderia sp. Bp9140 TaxID=2184572 RepID=UPI000F57D9D0|nr:hypothetical protein [Burkholderia sp. Bp9140]RQR46523.1 hypothetical protein DIE21_28915 [Burkholderia sp. Bp9140]